MFVAHKKKDRKSLDEDGILAALGSDTTVVHDHVTVNYNKDFHFKNAGFFADVKSYIDTCSRNDIPPFLALTRLMEGNPYTLKEILGGA